MKDKFKPWQRWVLFALAMAVIFASGVIISFLMEHSAEVVNVDYKKKIKINGIEAFRKFDDVYQGDLSKWLKFTNSLKLRMAMRLTYVPEMKEEARRIAEEAVTAGVITQNADNAFLKVEENRAAMVFNNWNDQHVLL